jgi:hypothetical protein
MLVILLQSFDDLMSLLQLVLLLLDRLFQLLEVSRELLDLPALAFVVSLESHQGLLD